MNTFEEFTQNMSKLESEAWDWVVRLDAEEPISAKERSALVKWLAASPTHVEQIRKLNDFWSNPILTELVFPTQAQKVKPAVQGKSEPVRTSFFTPAYGFSFGIMLAVVGGLFWFNNANQVDLNSNQIYATALGQQDTIKLSDGSEVILNSDSQLKVSYSDDTRNIWLIKGEAHFEVAKNQQRPFNVYAANGRVQAVGTAFTVDLSQKGDFNVLVTEGKISLALAKADKATAELTGSANLDNFDIHASFSGTMEDIAFMTMGDYTSINSNLAIEQVKSNITESIRRLDDNEIEAKSAWQKGELVYTGQSLAEVIEDLKRYTPIQIELVNAELANLKVGGRFKLDRIDALFKNLELNFDLTVQKVAIDKVIITKNQA